MKTFKVLVVAVVLCSSFPLVSQQVSGSTSESASASANGAQANQAAGASAQASRHGTAAQGSATSNSNTISDFGSSNGSGQMTSVSGELVGKLDSKTAKPGDPVLMKTTQKARTADGREIPKGTRLIGHVTDVQAHSSDRQDSHLGLAFDRAELKNGQTMAIHSVIESVSPSAAAANAAAMGSDDLFESAPLSGGGAIGGGARSGAGLAGGLGVLGGTGSVSGGAVNAVNSGTSSTTTSLGSTTRGTLNAAGGTAINAGRGTLNGAAAGTGSLAAHSTGIPGVMLGGDASGTASGMLSASKMNVRLDSGTQMVLGVSSAVK